MTTTDDARLVEIEARYERAHALFPDGELTEDVPYLLDRLKAAEGDNAELTRQVFAAYRRAEAAESRIRAAKSVIGRWESYDSIHADASRALSQIEEALHSGEVQGEGNGG